MNCLFVTVSCRSVGREGSDHENCEKILQLQNLWLFVINRREYVVSHTHLPSGVSGPCEDLEKVKYDCYNNSCFFVEPLNKFSKRTLNYFQGPKCIVLTFLTRQRQTAGPKSWFLCISCSLTFYSSLQVVVCVVLLISFCQL